VPRLFRASLGASLALIAGLARPAQTQEPQRAQQSNNGSITGVVTRASGGDPVDAATVRIPGMSLGATTNAQGRYTIANVTPGIYVVEAVHIGFAPKRKEDLLVSAGAPTTVDFALSEQSLMMDAVVATGLTDPISGAKAPFSVARLDASQLPVPSSGDVLQALAGKVAGATVRTTSGQPGSNLTIQLRAPTSFRSSTQPMIIVDGVIQLQDDTTLSSRGIAGSDLDVNPEDVASIEATLRAITSRLDVVDGDEEYEEVHHRIDELLTARDRVSPRDEVLV